MCEHKMKFSNKILKTKKKEQSEIQVGTQKERNQKLTYAETEKKLVFSSRSISF